MTSSPGAGFSARALDPDTGWKILWQCLVPGADFHVGRAAGESFGSWATFTTREAAEAAAAAEPARLDGRWRMVGIFRMGDPA